MLYLLLFISVASAASLHHKNITITTKYFPESFVNYSNSHNIIEITVPFNKMNMESVHAFIPSTPDFKYMFFVEGDVTSGVKHYKGAYVFKNDEAQMILENGQSITYGDNYTIYIGASDGIYRYNYIDDTVEKYGIDTKSVIRIQINDVSGDVYYLTSDHVLHRFKFNNDRNSSIVGIEDVRDFVVSYKGFLYYYDGNKQLHAYDLLYILPPGHSFFPLRTPAESNITGTAIGGLPSAPKTIELVHTAIVGDGYYAYAVVDGSVYGLKATSATELHNVVLQLQPAAYAKHGRFVQNYSYIKRKLRSNK